MERRLRDFLVIAKVVVFFLLMGQTLVLPFVCVYFFSEGDLTTTARLFLVWFLLLSVLLTWALTRHIFRRPTLGDALRDAFGRPRTLFDP